MKLLPRLLLLLALSTLAHFAQAAIYTVTSDSCSGSGSIVEAIANSNANSGTGTGRDTITFTPNLVIDGIFRSSCLVTAIDPGGVYLGHITDSVIFDGNGAKLVGDPYWITQDGETNIVNTILQGADDFTGYDRLVATNDAVINVDASSLAVSDADCPGDCFLGAGTIVTKQTGKVFLNQSALGVGSPEIAGQLLNNAPGNDRWDTGNNYRNIGAVEVIPDVTPIITATPNVITGVTNYNIIVKITELNNMNTDGLITVFIPKDPRWVLSKVYDSTATMIGSVAVDNAAWQYTNNGTQHVFTSTVTIPAGAASTFGFKAIWDAGATQGRFAITAQIVEGSGNENRFNNNVDAEVLQYFIQ